MKNKKPKNHIALTLDIDWAPNFMIENVARHLIDHKVKATWFVTHPCKAIENLKKYPDLFELGIHPNFWPNSTQGKTVEEILKYFKEFIPNARSMRTHDLFQASTLLGKVLENSDIITDSSIYLGHSASVSPTEFWWGNKKLLRLPFIWEDDLEAMRPNPTWKPKNLLNTHNHFTIFNFHPIHIFLNSSTLEPYKKYKEMDKSEIYETSSSLNNLIMSGKGTNNMFKELVFQLAANESSCFIDEIRMDCENNLMENNE